MSTPEQRSFEARIERLGDALAFVEDFCAARGIARNDLLRLTLVIEELFTNTACYGRALDAEPRIHIELDHDAAALRVLIEDTTAAFDPLQRLAAAPADADAEPHNADDKGGGHGIRLVAAMAQQLSYEHAGGRNRLRLRLPREPG